MPSSDDRFDKLESLIESRFQEMRTEMRTELRTELRKDICSDLRSELGSEMRAGFKEIRTEITTMSKRIDNLSAHFVELRRDFVSRVDQLANYTYLTDQGYLKMGDRVISLEQRVDKLESANARPLTQS